MRNFSVVVLLLLFCFSFPRINEYFDWFDNSYVWWFSIYVGFFVFALHYYLVVPFYKVGIKLLALLWLVTDTIEIVELALTYYGIDILFFSGIVQYILLGGMVLLAILRVEKFELPNFRDQMMLAEKHYVYLGFKRPTDFFSLMVSFFGGYGVSTLVYIDFGNNLMYSFCKKKKCLMRHSMNEVKNEGRHKGYIAIQTAIPVNEFKEFVDNKFDENDITWHYKKNNCLTAFKPMLERYGIKVNTYNPSKFFQRYYKGSYEKNIDTFEDLTI